MRMMNRVMLLTRAARKRWRERVGIEPTGAAEGASLAVLKTGQTTRPDPLPSRR